MVVATTAMLTACGNLGQVVKVADEVLKTVEAGSGITQDEAANGLKLALEFGVNNGTSFLG